MTILARLALLLLGLFANPMANHFSNGLVQEKRQAGIPVAIKKLFASAETSGDISGDWLQLEESTFNDLKRRGKIREDIKFKDLANPMTYDVVAAGYIKDLQDAHSIPTMKEAALWSWRPGWYKRYGGDVEAIPNTAAGVYKKSGKEVMRDRLKNIKIGRASCRERV